MTSRSVASGGPASLDDVERRRRALAILTQADDALRDASCPASTECCRFSVTGREPWVTQVEWAVVVHELKRQGRRLPPIPDDDDGRCPFLDDAAGRCRIYAARPLGCRTFFCERASVDRTSSRAALKRLPSELDALTVAQRGSDTGARPLRSWLASESGPPRRRR